MLTPETYAALEVCGVKYAIRLPADGNLERDVALLLPRPAGRPSVKLFVEYKSLLYQAASWKTARRVVARVHAEVEHYLAKLFPRIGFLVASVTLASREVVQLYSTPGTAEQWIKEGKLGVSSPSFLQSFRAG